MSLSHLSNFLVFIEMANLGELKVNLDSSTFSIEIYGGDVLKLLSIKVRPFPMHEIFCTYLLVVGLHSHHVQY